MELRKTRTNVVTDGPVHCSRFDNQSPKSQVSSWCEHSGNCSCSQRGLVRVHLVPLCDLIDELTRFRRC